MTPRFSVLKDRSKLDPLYSSVVIINIRKVLVYRISDWIGDQKLKSQYGNTISVQQER